MEPKEKLSESFWLFSIPLVGLFFAYCYEYGYCQFFHIPASLITVDLNSIASIVLNLLLYPLFIYGLDSLVSFLRERAVAGKDPERVKQLTVAFLFVLLILATFLLRLMNNLPYHFQRIDYLFAFGLAVWVLNIITTLVRKHSTSTTNEAEAPLARNTYLHIFFGRNIVNTILLLTILAGISVSYGTNRASQQKDFYKINTDSNFVGIKIYGNRSHRYDQSTATGRRCSQSKDSTDTR